MQLTLDYGPLAQFRYELRCFLNLTEHAARHAGIEPQQFQALLALEGLPAGYAPTVGMLAERLQIQHHSAVELVNRLETHGFLHRVRNRDDRREVLLHLTARGKRILRDLALPHREELRSAGFAILRALKKALVSGGHIRSARGGKTAAQNFKRAASAARISYKKR